ncbi:ATP synthase F0 subunit B [Candidatus Kaiserbacteria bacterium RIFCSPLOWO2_01_FULL_53_17]|uniref:ATP synthase subunit b n=1 Tax=Candidatus Kaiserbacteria bacterium RIFCSPLOWO2_01_FULL_53_17 TaxID=1798511 RepID=A0A1F6EGD8_9BACT|nr:MAG: ATP synthase F0 subunit B [Candidatus Kaiserbacteria bacterium RIFCSPLOWO2_01_FULL_53_17]
MSELFAAFGLNWKLLLIQALNFGILLYVLWRFLYDPVLKMIDERRGKIAEGVQKAEAADRRLSEADSEGKGIVAGAAKEAENLVSSARNRADEQASDILKRSQERADQVLADAQARAEEARRQTLAAGEKEIARAAMLAAEKILATRD